VDADAAQLRTMADEIAGDLAVWAVAAELERTLPGLEAARARAAELVARLDESLATLSESATARAARIAELEPALEAAEAHAAPVEPAREALRSAVERLEAGREAERLGAAALAAETAHEAAVAAAERAIADVRALLRRRLDGYAGDLASALVDGESCPVCGSVEHPRPAPPAHDPVSDDDVAAAEAAADTANDHAARASEKARAARAAHHEASTRAGGAPLAQLESAHAQAEVRVRDAVAAASAVTALKTELAQLRAADSAAAAERDTLTAQLADGHAARAAKTQEAATAVATVDAARADFAAVADRIAEAKRRRDLARALADAIDERTRLEAAAAGAETEREERLADSVFATAEEASAALLAPDAHTALAEEIRAHEVAFATERERLRVLETELAGAPEELVDLAGPAAAAEAAREAWNATVATAARDAEIATQLAQAAALAVESRAVTAERSADYEIIAGLADAIAGRTESRMDLETFVLAAELEQIVEAANLRLESMSSGRYRLQHTDAVGRRKVASGLGLSVLDAYTGQARPPQSLSGGETFLASLALALGLAEVVTARSGGVRLDTLFIDEGFGSLDDETLDLAMRTLDELRQGGRTLGLISHVATMKEQLPAQLLVVATPQGPSVIRQGAAILT
jgi:exonuclease SbcC